jgi:hypothetical protein
MIKETSIRKQELMRKLMKINDRMNELLGEKTTIIFKHEHDDMHPMLAMLKVQAIDFEAMLLSEEVEEIQNEFTFVDMVADCGLDFAKQDF